MATKRQLGGHHHIPPVALMGWASSKDRPTRRRHILPDQSNAWALGLDNPLVDLVRGLGGWPGPTERGWVSLDPWSDPSHSL